jgi:hypothetical protein
MSTVLTHCPASSQPFYTDYPSGTSLHLDCMFTSSPLVSSVFLALSVESHEVTPFAELLEAPSDDESADIMWSELLQ